MRGQSNTGQGQYSCGYVASSFPCKEKGGASRSGLSRIKVFKHRRCLAVWQQRFIITTKHSSPCESSRQHAFSKGAGILVYRGVRVPVALPRQAGTSSWSKRSAGS